MRLILGKTIGEIYLNRLKATPQHPMFQYKVAGRWEQLRMREFDERVRAVSYGLMGLEVQPRDKIALLSHTRLEWAVCDMAILGAGAITVPIYPSLPADDVATLIDHSDSTVAIVEDARQLQKVLDRRERLPKLRKIIVLDPFAMTFAEGDSRIVAYRALSELGRRQEARAPRKFEKQMLAAQPQDLFTICYTSGTTGQPKGAMLTHDNMVSVLEDVAREFSRLVRPDREVLVSFLPFSHVLGRLESIATYVFGWRECYAQTQDTLMNDMGEINPTIMFAVPRVFEKAKVRIDAMMQDQPTTRRKLYEWALEIGRNYHSTLRAQGPIPASLRVEYALARRLVFSRIVGRMGGRLRAAICGGAPLPQQIAEYFQAIGVDVLEGYGLTETCAPVAVNRPETLRPGTVGRPLPEVSVKIAEDGEILIRSRKVFLGYYKMPDETREVLDEDGWLHTGDIGHLDADGFLHVTDRKKDIIVLSSGKNVAPQKVENLLKARPYVSQAFVYGDRRNYLIALITPDRELLQKYAQEQQILFSDIGGLIKNAKIQALFQRQVEEVNAHLASFETIKKFIILPSDFTVDSGDLTPSLKIKRKAVIRRFKSELDQIYTEPV